MNYNISKIFIKNDINRFIILIFKIKLDIISDYEVINYFIINSSQYNLIIKAFKRLLN